MKLKKIAIQAIIEAHQLELKKALDCAENFKDNKTFPNTTPDELKKAANIRIAIEKLHQFKTDDDDTAETVKDGLMAEVDNSYHGKRFYFFFKETECHFVKMRFNKSDIMIYVVDSAEFKLSKVGQVRIYEHGRPGDLFEAREEILQIF